MGSRDADRADHHGTRISRIANPRGIRCNAREAGTVESARSQRSREMAATLAPKALLLGAACGRDFAKPSW